jgi:hypothetical protein
MLRGKEWPSLHFGRLGRRQVVSQSVPLTVSAALPPSIHRHCTTSAHAHYDVSLQTPNVDCKTD